MWPWTSFAGKHTVSEVTADRPLSYSLRGCWGRIARTVKPRERKKVDQKGMVSQKESTLRDSDRDIPVSHMFRYRVVLPEQQLLAELIAGSGPLTCASFRSRWSFRTAGVLRVAQDLAALAAVVGDPGLAIGETDDGALAVVRAEGAGACWLHGV